MLKSEEVQNSKRYAEGGKMLVEADAIREVADMFTGTSEELTYSPASLGRALYEFSENRRKHGLELIKKTTSTKYGKD